MVKISFFLVFSIVLALPFRSVIGQDWNELVNQAGLTQQTLDEAKKAIGAANDMAGAAAGQEALNDYQGGSEDVAETGAALADLIDNDGNNIVDTASPSDNIVDPPQDQTSAMVDAQETPDDDPNFTGIPYAPSESPISEAPGYAAPSKAPEANAPSRAPAAANAPIKTPKLAPTNEAVEAPEDAEDEDDPVIVPPPMAAAPELDH